MKTCIACFILCLCMLLSACSGEEEQVLTIVSQAEKLENFKASPLSDEQINCTWHGQWEIFACSGIWAEFENFCWECWAECENNHILIWDVDIPKEEALAKLELMLAGEEYTISSGRFMDVYSGFDSWRISFSDDEDGQLLTIRGQYDGKADGRFSFAFYLRPEIEE